MWPFTKKPNPKPGKKLAIINVRDYPRQLYTAYWELFVSPDAPHYWRGTLIDYATGEHVLSATGGPLKTEDDARRESQQWVLDNIESFRRSFS